MSLVLFAAAAFATTLAQAQPYQHAVIWNGTVATDLNTFLDQATRDAGWVLLDASGINDRGWITGQATNELTGQGRAFLLVPVPEAGMHVLLLTGLAALGWVVAIRRGGNQRKTGAPPLRHVSLMLALRRKESSMHRNSVPYVVAAIVFGLLCAPDADASTSSELDALQPFIRNAIVHPDGSGGLVTETSSAPPLSFRGGGADVVTWAFTAPRPNVHSAVIPYDVSFSEGSSTLDYWFAVVGASAGESVPVLLTTVIAARRDSEDSQSRAVLDIGEGVNPGGVQTGTFHEQLTCSQTSACTFGEFSSIRLRNEPITILSSTEADAHIYQVSVSTFAQSFGGGVGSAFVDPILFQIDPGFPGHDEFSLVFSAGVRNETPPPIIEVPEPSEAVLLLAGLLALFGLLGRKPGGTT
ncbi:MAG TPA: hypothetical protein VF169_12570 [Albitalea sp.]